MPRTVNRLPFRFDLGNVYVTPGAMKVLDRYRRHALTVLARHRRGDWGDLGADDWEANEQALEHGSRILSVYKLSEQDRVWVITEADRSATTILLPVEY